MMMPGGRTIIRLPCALAIVGRRGPAHIRAWCQLSRIWPFAMALHDSGLDSTAWLAAIVESTDDAIISKDLNGIITSWNLGAERIFGYTAHEIVGHHILELFPPDRHAEEDYILSAIRKGERIKQ